MVIEEEKAYYFLENYLLCVLFNINPVLCPKSTLEAALLNSAVLCFAVVSAEMNGSSQLQMLLVPVLAQDTGCILWQGEVSCNYYFLSSLISYAPVYTGRRNAVQSKVLPMCAVHQGRIIKS